MGDVILFIGRISVGKTEAETYFLKKLKELHIGHHDEVLSDARFIVQAVKADDEKGGSHHVHEWCMKTISHTHDVHPSPIPFIVTDSHIPKKMMMDFFDTMIHLADDDTYWVAEWAGGKNGYPKNHKYHKIDFSYTSAFTLLSPPNQDRFIDKILAVIDITATNKTRMMLNQKNSIPEEKKLKDGKIGWKRHEETFRFFNTDDFKTSGFYTLLKQKQKLFFQITNTGNKEFYDKLDQVMAKIF